MAQPLQSQLIDPVLTFIIYDRRPAAQCLDRAEAAPGGILQSEPNRDLACAMVLNTVWGQNTVSKCYANHLHFSGLIV